MSITSKYNNYEIKIMNNEKKIKNLLLNGD